MVVNNIIEPTQGYNIYLNIKSKNTIVNISILSSKCNLWCRWIRWGAHGVAKCVHYRHLLTRSATPCVVAHKVRNKTKTNLRRTLLLFISDAHSQVVFGVFFPVSWPKLHSHHKWCCTTYGKRKLTLTRSVAITLQSRYVWLYYYNKHGKYIFNAVCRNYTYKIYCKC